MNQLYLLLQDTGGGYNRQRICARFEVYTEAQHMCDLLNGRAGFELYSIGVENVE